MNHFHDVGGVLHCEGVSLEAIAAAVGTPAYVYSTATLERHYDVFAAAFAPRRPLIAFAVKANGNLAVLATLARRGAGADTVSAGEIKRALAAGVAAQKIIFSGVGKTAEELAFALRAGVLQINVESRDELDVLERCARDVGVRAPMALRVNPDVSGGGHEKIATGRSGDKFGVGADDAAQLYARACASAHFDPRGLAVHIGSQIHDLAPLRAAFETLRGLAYSLRGQGFSVAQLDLGGGLGAPYFNAPDPPSPADYAAMVESVFAGTDFMLAFEPGRAIAANAGVLISRVIRIQERAGRRILVMDAAMNDLVRPAMYDAYHDLRPVRASADARAPFDIVGPICESGDTFARGRAITPMGPGDLAAFFTAGAYGAVMASAYNARALTPEVLVAGDAFAVVRRRWDVEAQMALENMPDWLSRE